MINGGAHRGGEMNGNSSASSSVSSPLRSSPPPSSMRELIIMTPVSQGEQADSHLIRVERFRYDVNDVANLPGDILHVAGGQHSGIVVRKQISRGKNFNYFLFTLASGLQLCVVFEARFLRYSAHSINILRSFLKYLRK